MGIVGTGIEHACEMQCAADYTGALVALRPALDETARAYYGADRPGKDLSHQFLSEHMHLLTLVGLGNIHAEGIRLQGRGLPGSGFARRDVPLEQVIYHFMTRKPDSPEMEKLRWDRSAPLYLDPDGTVCLTPTLISALIVCIASCPTNRDERVSDAAWLATERLSCPLNELWGSYYRILTQLGDEMRGEDRH